MTALDYAYQFANLGMPVFPVEVKGKKPLTEHGFKDATTDNNQILEWSQKYSNCNWAVATGDQSGIIVVDIDPRNGGIESMRNLVAEHGDLPLGPVQKTGGNGYHHFFRTPAISHLRSGKLASGIDIKTNGGYIILPGSVTENEYEWLEGKSIIDISLPDVPGWIISSLNSKQEFSFDEDGYITEGNRNNYLASIGGTLRRRGASLQAITAALIAENNQRIRPQLGRDEVIRIADSMMNYEPDSDIIKSFLNNEEIDLDMRADADNSEKAIIGYLLSGVGDEDMIIAILQGINGDYLVNSNHKQIFKAAYTLWVEGVNITPDNIYTQLKAKKISLKNNEINDIVEASVDIIYIADINFHIKRIREAWMLRQSVSLFTYAASASQKGKRTPQDIVNEVVGQLMSLIDHGAERSKILTTKQAVMEVRQMLLDPDSAIHQMNEPTGIDFLDEFIIGLPKGEITIIAGRPSQGKTAAALKIAYSMANRCSNDEAVVFFSAEMTGKQLMMRNISRESKINSIQLRKGLNKLSIEDRLNVESTMDFMDENINIFIDETVSPSGQYMLSKVMGINAKKKVKLVVFDFLELAGLDEADKWAQSNKVLRIEQAIVALKTIAKIFNIPIIVVSQLSREVENRSNSNTAPIPRNSDLRWSGMTEQLANVIIMVYYPWFFYNSGIQYETIPDKEYYEFRITKNRDGEVGPIPAKFIKQYGEFLRNDDVDSKSEEINSLPWDE